MPLERMENFFNTHADIYDSHMLDDLKLAEFYETISGCFSTPIGRLLDLGCGTGLELDLLFKQFPDMEVTGIELSAEMLKKLGEKYPDKKLNLICGSYFDEDFGGTYDCVLSTYSLHHFAEDKKLALYQKIHTALKQDGFFVFGDYIVKTAEQQQALLIENEKIRREQGISDGEFYHFDTPFTPETEIRLIKTAGFVDIQIIRQWENKSIIVAKRES